MCQACVHNHFGLRSNSSSHAVLKHPPRSLQKKCLLFTMMLRDGKRPTWDKVGKHTLAVDETLIRNGTWTDLSIFASGRFNQENCLRLPQICDILKREIDLTSNPSGVALISQLHPGAEIVEHVGITNAELTFHLGIQVPANHSSGIRVGDEEREWVQGRVLAFDDSFNHKVWHRGSGSEPRTVLLVRMWHPEVSIRERQVALHLLRNEQNPKQKWRGSDVSKALRDLDSMKATEAWNAQARLVGNELI
mmetsp:Transcript_144710/g.277785  ORF Transcript_144710/g.277785 Transcript_144710/m.277785 type:complete len:249 (-) Transcript_144710:32-778(-)